ncbi:hypothetical protein [Halosimplex halobium]|uniref:hypothetical protein n=1 Tax=Halosimplex halobium TaxID=3396618 RepID=UPI003F560AEB
MSLVERLQLNWSDELPHGVMEWQDETDTVIELEILPNRPIEPDGMSMTDKPMKGAIGLVVSPPTKVDEYVDVLADDTVDIPKYYSRFPDNREPMIQHGDDAIFSEWVEAAVRVLNGGGRYDESEFTLYDCLVGDPQPCLLLREGVGAVLLAPADLSPEVKGL